MIKALTLGLVLMSCASFAQSKSHSSDFTAEWSFTKGIEGPGVNSHRDLFVVNYQKQGTIGLVKQDGTCSIFAELPAGSIGNGIRFDHEDNMYIADYTGHNILKIASGQNSATIFVHNDQMNQPNDIAIAPNGTIYASDPNWKDNSGQIWMITTDQKIVLIQPKMGTTNGIEVSPDGKFLYVNESIQRKVWRFKILSDGELTNKTLFFEFPDYGMDGMRCDRKGNLYIARYDKGTVAVLSPKGKMIDEILLKGKKPSNITFGGSDGKTCYVTLADRGCLEIFRAKYAGREFIKLRKK
ncbi:MAG: SMP-30/gluconolactonase/LRE family protein [Bacteroidota bacterium]|nr:SMP-30/gluconolactonase/LRE family protein [Bacteroidota bacterium]